MLFTLFVSVAFAGNGAEKAYVEQQMVREVHDTRHYETSYVSSVVGDKVVTTPQQNLVGTMTFEVMKNKVALSGWDFAAAVGDDGLVTEMREKEHRTRRRCRVAMVVGAAALLTGGVALQVADDDSTFPITPLLGLGGIGLIGGASMNVFRRDYGDQVENFYSIEEIDALIQTYNAELARSLGLNPDTMSSKHPGVVTFDR